MRLPHDTAAMVQAFSTSPSTRGPRPASAACWPRGIAAPSASPDAVVDRLGTGSVAVLALPTPAAGPPLEEDVEVAEAARGGRRLLGARGAVLVTEAGERPLLAADISHFGDAPGDEHAHHGRARPARPRGARGHARALSRGWSAR